MGLPEKVKGRDPTEFIEHWLIDLFGKEAFTPLFVVERAHRVPTIALPGSAPKLVLAHRLQSTTVIAKKYYDWRGKGQTFSIME